MISFKNSLRLGKIHEPHPGIFVFDLLTPEFCTRLLEHIASIKRTEAPNSMNKYGTILDEESGLYDWLGQLTSKIVAPISKKHYPDRGVMKNHYGFIIDYSKSKQRSLDEHVDTSEVTLNVCLGKKFTGGKLRFAGPRCLKHEHVPSRPEEHFEFEHAVGRAIVHRGQHLHQAKPLRSGSRTNLVVWCSSRKKAPDGRRVHPVWCAA